MDFISSISFPNEPLISWTFLGNFCHPSWVGATANQQQTNPKMMTKIIKKCSTDQRFIRKPNTTYKIGTLAVHLFHHKNFRNDLANTYIFFFAWNFRQHPRISLKLRTSTFVRRVFFRPITELLGIWDFRAAMILFERSAEGRNLFCTGRLSNESSYEGKVEVLDFSHEIHTSD